MERECHYRFVTGGCGHIPPATPHLPIRHRREEPETCLEQNYDVPGIFADATEDRRLLRWSRINPEWIYFTRFEGRQLGGVHVGLYRCNIRTGSLEVVDDTIEEGLALSEDETRAAYLPIEGP